MKKKKHYTFSDLIQIMRRLRGPHGCAWDRAQDHTSLLQYLFEETQEVSHAVETGDMQNLQEELGDILLQVLFHAQIASEQKIFSIRHILDTLGKKLIRRHPHVFGKKRAATPEEIIKNWHRIKQREKIRDSANRTSR